MFKIGDTAVTHLTHDSRTVHSGSCFFAIAGGKTNGNMYVMSAVSNGASIIVAERGSALPEIPVPVLYVDDVRAAMAHAAKRFHNDICDRMTIVGITGTNGKTTSTYILRTLLGGPHARKIGVVGTLGAFVGDIRLECDLTTPDPIKLHEIFAQMYKLGVRTVAMEVSAHAIHHKKIAGITFAAGVFTNLTQDHLDFFPTFDDYAQTKLRFMTDANVRTAITNVDDHYGRRIVERAKTVHKYSITNDATDIVMLKNGSRFTAYGHEFFVPLAGRFNIENALACITTAHVLGVSYRTIAKRLATVAPVSGRFNVVEVPTPFRKGGAAEAAGVFHVIIDYAHTPDGLEKILTNARELVKKGGKLLVVFGCGGNRDRAKREIMGQIAAQHADLVFITSDNPRDESPTAIMMQIEAGLKSAGMSLLEPPFVKGVPEGRGFFLDPDRRAATHAALDAANAGDVVVIAGKGAESTIELAGKFIPYSDAETVAQYI